MLLFNNYLATRSLCDKVSASNFGDF